jgi:hypothetical protein
MTLVVSDISSLGVIMVGDSAITQKKNDGSEEVIPGAVKVQYSSATNIGLAMWGFANVGNKMLDHWIADFINNSIRTNDSVEKVGQEIATQLNSILSTSGNPWKEMVCGIHVAGYRNGLPCLFHVHCGHDNEPAHELRIYKDYPDDQQWSERYFNYLLEFGFIHLRNGYHPLFGPLFDRILEYSGQLRVNFNISFPQNTLKGRFEFYKLLVKFVAGTLVASGLYQGVNDILSAVAFNQDGLVFDERIELQKVPPKTQSSLSNYFLD